jgi:hypothetical protein
MMAHDIRIAKSARLEGISPEASPQEAIGRSRERIGVELIRTIRAKSRA